jgi:hypothetical protein
VAILVLLAFAAGCGGTPQTSAPPTGSPVPRALLPLTGTLDGIPRPGDTSVVIPPHSPVGIVEVGVPVGFTLGHCGLISPIDLEGSLWDPIGADNGLGGQLTEEQQGELVNATAVTLTLEEANRAVLVTPRGAVVTLSRNDGPRLYFLCD